jgi:pSer/pThr/pTyr-binding forkhead associated (FHA) protein
MYVVEIMNGPLDGKRWEFCEHITIGRDAGSVDVALPVDKAVSRCHARLHAADGRLFITDLDSSNGTHLGGKRIDSPTAVLPNQPFVVGRTLLRVAPAACDGANHNGAEDAG